MRLDQAEPAAVPLRAPAGPRLNRKSGLLQCQQQRSRSLTAVASRIGVLTYCRMRVSLAGVFAKKPRMFCAALLLVQSLYASVRLLTWFEPPAARA